MRRIIDIPVAGVTPGIESVLAGQGIYGPRDPEPHIVRLAEEAISLYKEKALPAGLVQEVSVEEFLDVYEGAGMNETDSPVKPICRASDDLALFAVTIDENISAEINRLFSEKEFALGSMLDSAASAGAEMTAQETENFYRRHLEKIGRFGPGRGIMRFSPGYCGWHMSSQRTLFRLLRPEDIEIILNENFLMTPLKSISGVVVSGAREIFNFEDTFGFCAACTVHSCRDRIKALSEQ